MFQIDVLRNIVDFRIFPNNFHFRCTFRLDFSESILYRACCIYGGYRFGCQYVPDQYVLQVYGHALQEKEILWSCEVDWLGGWLLDNSVLSQIFHDHLRIEFIPSSRLFWLESSCVLGMYDQHDRFRGGRRTNLPGQWYILHQGVQCCPFSDWGRNVGWWIVTARIVTVGWFWNDFWSLRKWKNRGIRLRIRHHGQFHTRWLIKHRFCLKTTNFSYLDTIPEPR